MTKKSEFRKLWEADKNLDIQKASKKIGLNDSAAYRYVREFKSDGVEAQIKRKVKKVKSGGGLGAFKNQYDDSVIVPQKIETGIKQFLRSPKGDPDWMRDKDFREACCIGVGKWRRYADDYKELQVVVNGEIIWGHPEIIEEMRRSIQR